MASKSFEVRGEWWLPDGDEVRVPGVLTFSGEAGAQLSLMGALRDFREAGEASTAECTTTIRYTEESMERAGFFTRILGQADGAAWTLEDGFQTRRTSRFGGGMELQDIHVNRVFRGVWFDADEAATATGVNGQVSVLAVGHGRSSLVAIECPRVRRLLGGV